MARLPSVSLLPPLSPSGRGCRPLRGPMLGFAFPIHRVVVPRFVMRMSLSRCLRGMTGGLGFHDYGRRSCRAQYRKV